MHNRHIIALLLASCLFALCSLASLGCSPQLSATGTDSKASEATVSDSWSESSDCTPCHGSEADSAANASSLCGHHASLGLDNCGSCHTDTDGALTKAHAHWDSGRQATSLWKTAVDDDTCASCHDVSSLVSKTADYAGLTDANGKTVNPHEIIGSATHEDAGIKCVSCHKTHIDNGTNVEVVLSSAESLCASCHHAGVYECNTCHT